MNLRNFALAALVVTSLAAQDRFDSLVREDFFAGFAGNTERLQHGMAVTETVLAANPNHAEALVWHGAGLQFLAQAELQKGNTQAGLEQLQKGIAEMDRAAALEPDNIGVRIPRGATLREITRYLPPQGAAPLLETARTDFQHAYELQKESLANLGTHPLGELLQGLGDIYSRQGKAEEAAQYYGMIEQRLPGSEYARRAVEWMQTRQPLPPARSACYGCHTGK